MLNLIDDLKNISLEEDFRKSFLDAYDKRYEKNGYLYSRADPTAKHLIEKKVLLTGKLHDEEVRSKQPPDKRQQITDILVDSMVLGYIAQMFFVEWISERIITQPLPQKSELSGALKEYTASVGPYWPYNPLLDKLADHVSARIKSSDELSWLKAEKPSLQKWVKDQIHVGQVLAILQNYLANLNNMREGHPVFENDQA